MKLCLVTRISGNKSIIDFDLVTKLEISYVP